MNIVSSIIVWDLPQTDGRHVVREEHADDQGNVYDFDYIAEIGMDINARLAARAIELGAQ